MRVVYALQGKATLLNRVIFMVVTLVLGMQMLSVMALANDGKKEIMIPPGNREEMSNIQKIMSDERYYIIPKDGERVNSSPVVTTEENKLIFDYESFEKGTAKSQNKVIKALVKAIKDQRLPRQTEQMLIDGISDASSDARKLMLPLVFDELSADVNGASRTMSPFIPVIRWVLGILVVLMFLATFIQTAADMMFMGIPAFRNWAEGAKKEGGRAGNGLVSMDAQYAIKEAEASIQTAGGYKNPYWIYFGKRIWMLVIMSFCVLYLLLGELGGLISLLINLGSGFLD